MITTIIILSQNGFFVNIEREIAARKFFSKFFSLVVDTQRFLYYNAINTKGVEVLEMFEPLKMKKRSVILDTDIGPDCDDVGALAVLFSYARENDVPILGVCNCTSNKYGTATVDAIREYCEYPELALGAYSKPGFYEDAQRYNKYIADTYSSKHKNGTLEVLSHVDFYRSLLASAEDDSVVIVTIGMFNAFADFLRSEGDGYSPLSGIELAKKKISSVVSMAAVLPAGREFNVICDYEASKFVFDNCPAPMYLSDFKLGYSIFTGYEPSDAEKYKNNPIFDSYWLYTNDRARPGFNRSFDLTAVQFAFEGEGELYSLGESGRLEFFNEAPDRLPYADATKFVPCGDGNIRFMIKNVSDEEIAASLQTRMDEFNK